jgi:hypothetical protein
MHTFEQFGDILNFLDSLFLSQKEPHLDQFIFDIL